MKFVVRAYDANALGLATGTSLIREVSVDAPNAASAVSLVQSRGLMVVSAKAAQFTLFQPRRRKFDKASVLLFCQELLALLQAGMGLVEAIDILQQKAKDPVVAQVLGVVMEHLRSGKTLSQAMELSHLSPAQDGVNTASSATGAGVGQYSGQGKKFS